MSNIPKLFPAFRAPFLAGNTADIIALFDDDATFFDLQGTAYGVDAIRPRFDALFERVRILAYEVHQRDERLLGPDYACGTMTFTSTSEILADRTRSELSCRSSDLTSFTEPRQAGAS